MPLNAFAENTPTINNLVYQPADHGTHVALGAGIPTARRVDTILVNSDAAVATTVNVYDNDGTTDNFLGSVSVPAHSGAAGVPTTDLLSALFPSVQVGIALPAGHKIVVDVDTITAALSFHEIGGIF